MRVTNQLHLYFGDGQGKTSSAMGMALRALGHDRHVLVAQFMKDGRSGELTTLKRIGAVIFDATPTTLFAFEMNETERAQAVRQNAQDVTRLIKLIEDERPDLVVLDELALAAQLEMVAIAAAHQLIDTGLKYGEVIITGRQAPESLIERADYVSEIKSRRHPFYDKGLSAREGVEW